MDAVVESEGAVVAVVLDGRVLVKPDDVVVDGEALLAGEGQHLLEVAGGVLLLERTY